VALFGLGAMRDLSPQCAAARTSDQHAELFRGHAVSAASWCARTQLDGRIVPAPIAPTPDDAALMSLRRYCA
jgi:hypothetical protein